MRYLFLLFVLLPIIEILLLIELGSRIGTLNTLGLIVITAIIGSWMLRQQGLSTLFRAREKISVGQLPLLEMLEAICLAVGGALLVTPGLVTDCIGFACLLPVSRRRIVSFVASRGNWQVYQSYGEGGFSAANFRSGSDVIEGEYEETRREDVIKDDRPKKS